jgi:hypothetical protein
VLLLVAVLVLADLPDGDEAPDDGSYVVMLQGYQFVPTELAIPAGRPVTLTFDNLDEVSHDVSIGRVVEERDGRAIGFGEDLLAGIPLEVSPRRCAPRSRRTRAP